jgi:hypothetical protein
MESDECSVCVAVHVRPLIEDEEDAGCRTCLAVAPDEPQVDRMWSGCRKLGDELSTQAWHTLR